MDLVEAVYALTRSSLPPEERYGLATQMQRAAVSIPCNIAEGHGRKSIGAYLNHLYIAHGALTELETLLQLAARLGYLSPASLGPMVAITEEVGRSSTACRFRSEPSNESAVAALGWLLDP